MGSQPLIVASAAVARSRLGEGACTHVLNQELRVDCGFFSLLFGNAEALLSNCGLFANTGYLPSMNVEAEAPQGVKNRSSVYAVRGFTTCNFSTGCTSPGALFKGKAGAVELAGGRMLFVLLRMANGGNFDDNLAITSMRAMYPAFGNNRKGGAQRITRGIGVAYSAEIAPMNYPLLVAFGDIEDSINVSRGDPAGLAASKGNDDGI